MMKYQKNLEKNIEAIWRIFRICRQIYRKKPCLPRVFVTDSTKEHPNVTNKMIYCAYRAILALRGANNRKHIDYCRFSSSLSP